MIVLVTAFGVIGGLLVLAMLGALTLVLKDVATKEAAAVVPEMTRGLVDRARNQLPAEARARFEEEWPAGFEKAIEKRPAWAFRQAIYLYVGARRLARVLEPATVPAGRQSRLTSAGTAASAGAGRVVNWLQHLLQAPGRLTARVDGWLWRFGEWLKAMIMLNRIPKDFVTRFVAGALISMLTAGVLVFVATLLGR